YCQPNYPAG
nr:immunoglobulin heavy chain junction region [Homo sapiens]